LRRSENPWRNTSTAALTVTAALLAVVDEILAEQAIHGAQVPLVDRLRVETTDKLPVRRLALHGASLT